MNKIRIKINVKQIDKTMFFAGKIGALYLDAELVPKKGGPDEWGWTYGISQIPSKEQRLAGIKGPWIGDAKELIYDNKPKPATITNPAGTDDDIPF